jgi:hypothetical protein
MAQRKKITQRIRALLILMVTILGIPSLCSMAYQIDRLQNPLPPGVVGFFDSSAWDKDSISYFLGVEIPADADDLQFEGIQGRLGSFGNFPNLQFSFRASPNSATAFVKAFCNGQLHTGFNPLASVDSYLPSRNAILIRAVGTIHYSHSPSTPHTTAGNRCARQV